ncbi:hypothetical protein Ptr902_10617 [Pyrenophora tritici-repentis]|nr:hypothetical protein Ptr902_10617 [Pyrenophora tritici-repentis]
MRTAEDKKKCRDRGACYKCGKAGHTQFNNDAPCRGKPITPSSEIPFLAAIDRAGFLDAPDRNREQEQNWRLSVKASKRRVRQNEILELANDVPRTHYLSAASLHESPKVDISHQLEFRCGLRSPTGSWRKDATLVDTTLADGEEVAKLTHAADILVRYGNYVSTLDQHQPVLGFRSSWSITFDHKDCKVNCLKDGVQDTVYEDRAPESASRGMSAGKVSIVSAKAACLLAAQDPQSVVWLEPHHFDKIDQPKDPSPARRDQLNADKFAERLDKLREFLRQQITWAQAKQAEYANNHRLPAPEFKVGDRVIVDFRNLRTTRPNQSLDYKNRGPFLVTRVIDNMAYEVALPAGMRAHNVFHPWLLHRVSEQPLPGQVQDEEGHFELADPDIDDDTNYSVEAVLDSRINKQLRDPALNKKGLLQY